MSCGIGHRRGSDPTLLWLWQRSAAIAPILPLTWELPYIMGAALKRKKKKKKKRERECILKIGFVFKEKITLKVSIWGPWKQG